ncbi:hypothetical protein EX895_001103 [Sporisorium graminicola]|uniref:Membrane anchor Opy2 N-terminal domain-containing protein n=1 Tax=Sporisorium graminicola TaxID=280036 RepID=A0A4U7KZH3_9BASI|nr:hypothetical protein EX895_001103 [Sporisorium graminicola]TKY89806.1 hypothetical protein EX895_001103 [Sporisorium graminicola]
MRRSHPTAFVLKKRDSCAVCNNIAPCPVCPKGQQCQQIFRSSCQDCPVNKCVPIPGYSANNGSNKSALGGGLAALFIVALAAGTAFWFWRRLKAKRRLIALHHDAMERREKLRNEKEAITLQLGGAKSASRTSADPTSPFALVDDDDLLDNDTEYTQVTGVLNNNSDDQDRLGSLAEPTAFRRRSFGAATHLSRITEGAEEEEEEPMPNNNTNGASAAGQRKRNTVGSIQSTARSLASGAGPRISIASGTSSFGSHNIIPIAFKPSPSNPRASAATPATADGERGVDGTDDTSSLAGYQAISPLALPSTAHRATGAPSIQVNTARQGPVRPTRAPDLNLRLPEPHKPAASSPLAQSTAHNMTPAADANQPAYQFMSIDPVEALKSSGPYSRSDRPLSGATINTIGSTHSGSLSYVLSAPQVITPVSAEGVRRVQLGNGGKAQLVKVPSLKRKDSKKEKSCEDPFSDPRDEGTLLPPPANRFGSAAKAERLSTISTSTLGIPFGENPFGPSPFSSNPPNQTSPSDAEERSSWLGSTADSALSRTNTTPRDPFQDPSCISRAPTSPDESGNKADGELRTSIGGLSLLAQFPFDVSQTAGLPENALQRVEQFK